MIAPRTLFALVLIGAAVQTSVPTDPGTVGYLNLHQRHPSGASGPVEFETAYTAAAAVRRVEQIGGFLASFRRLTERVRTQPRVTREDLDGVGNTSRETQSLAFHNLPLIVEGTVLKQEYLLRQAQYEIARLKRARGDAGDGDVERARQAYAEATRAFQAFWDKKLPID